MAEQNKAIINNAYSGQYIPTNVRITPKQEQLLGYGDSDYSTPKAGQHILPRGDQEVYRKLYGDFMEENRLSISGVTPEMCSVVFSCPVVPKPKDPNSKEPTFTYRK